MKRIVCFCLTALMLTAVPCRAFAADGETPAVSSGTIVIDGNFDDWDDIPKTVITWDNQHTDEDGKKVHVDHTGALYWDGDILYVMFQEDARYVHDDKDKNTLQLQNMEMDIGIYSQDKVLKVLPVDGNGNIVGEAGAPMKDMPDGVHTDFGVFVFGKSGSLVNIGTDVAYQVQKNEDGNRIDGDRVEFGIDLEKLAEYWKVDLEDIKTIKIQNHWLGKEMSITGSPTYAYTLLLIAVPIAVIGYVMYAKNKKKSVRDTPQN